MTEPTFSLDKMIQQAQEAAVSRVPATTDPRSFADTGFQPLNKYDAGLRVGMDQDEYRASQQSLAQAFGNALVQSAGEVALGTLEGIGYMVDLPQWFNIARGTEKEFGNWFSDLMREGKEGIREEMPIYGGSEAFDPGNAKWWMANLPNIASSLSLMIPSVGAVKGLSAAGRLVRGASKLERIAAGTGRAAEKAKAIIGMRQGVQSALFSRYMENIMEAKEAMESNYEELIRQGVPENEALERAAQTASNVWRANIANLVTDIPQYMLLMKGPKGLAGAARETKSIAKKIWDSTPMALGRQAVSEGAEEGFQYGIQQKAKEAAGGWDTVKKAIAGVPEFAYDDEFWGSVTLGAAGGVVFEAGGRAAKGIMEKTIDRYKKSSQAYEQGDWVTGLKQQYDEARDMMLRGETDKLRDIASMSEDPKFAPVVEKMVRRMEELSTSIPGIDNKEEVMKLFADNLFYNDAVTDLDVEVKSLMSENASTLNGNKLAKKALELIEASDATNKEKLKNDILSRFGVTKESVEQEEAMTGGMAPVAERKVSQMVDAMKMADQTQKDADTKLREGRQRMQQANQPAAGQTQPGQQQQQANPQTQLQQQIRNAEAVLRNATPQDIITRIQGNILPSEVMRLYITHAANKMREELDSEDVSMFADEESYLSALNKDGSFMKEFGDRIRNANGKTANDVARDRWARHAQRMQSRQQPTQQPEAPPAAPASTMTGMPEAETEEQLFPEEPPAQERQEYGTTNTTFTRDAYEEARRRFRGTGNLTAGFDPELLQAAITMAGYHIEAGARSFAAFAKAMINDIGEAVKPYLKPAYNAIRDLNQLDPAITEQMDDYQTVMAADIDAVEQKQIKEDTAVADIEKRRNDAIAFMKDAGYDPGTDLELVETIIVDGNGNRRKIEAIANVIDSSKKFEKLREKIDEIYDAELAELQTYTEPVANVSTTTTEEVTIDNEHINPKYRGKIVYASPGAGKTTLASKNSAIIDMDQLIIAEIIKEAPAFARANENISDQDFIERFNGYEVAPGVYGIDARNKINTTAVEKARTLTGKGYTVLTGTLAIMDKADEIIILNPESQRKEERFHGKKEALEFSLKELKEVKATNRSHVITDKIEDEILGTGQQPPVAAEPQQEPTADANDEALARQLKALDKGPEPDGTWMAIYKPVPSGQEVEKIFETKSQAEQWLTEKYTEAKRYKSPQYDQSDIQDKEAVQEEPPIQYGNKEIDDRKAILEEAIFDAKGENEVKLDTDYRISNGREHMFGLTMDVVIETDPVKGTFRPVVVNGKPKTYESVGPATIWTKTGLSNTVSYAEAQDYVRHLSDKMDWRDTPVFIEVDPTIEFHQPRSKPTTTPSANPKSPGMDYTDSEIKAERDRFFAANRNMPQDKLEDTWAVEESFMRMPGAKGADNMAVSYVIYDNGKRIPIAMMYSQSLSRQHFGLWRSSPQWMVRYELWKQWKASQERGVTSEPVRHPVTTRFATDGKGNPVYMGGRFLDIPGADFAIEDFKHDTPSGKHLVLMVPIFKAQGTVVEVHNDRPLGRIMNTGNYSPGLPYVLVKDAMGNYLWSRAYSRRMVDTGQRGRDELAKILSPVSKVKEAFRRRLEQLGYDPDAASIPDDVRAEISRYKPDSKNPIKRSEARFPEVYDFVQTGWKRVADDLSTMFRWREEVNGKTVYGPVVKALRESADGVPSLLFGFNESTPASPFSLDKFIGYYSLEERPLQIDVTKIEDTEYVESIAWRLKTNTDPSNPMVSPTFFFDVPTSNDTSEKSDSDFLFIDEDVNEIFQESPELSKIGTAEEYREYVSSIFPNSNVRRVVYRGAGRMYEKGEAERHWTFTKKVAQSFAEISQDRKVFFAVVNLLNPENVPGISDSEKRLVIAKSKEQGFDSTISYSPFGVNRELPLKEQLNQLDPKYVSELTFFDSSQIHILGTEKDASNFKEWVESRRERYDEYEGLSEEDIADLEDMKAGRGKYDPEFGINEDGDQADPDFLDPDSDEDFSVMSTYDAVVADYFDQDLNKMEPYLIERLMNILDRYKDEVTPDYKAKAGKDFKKMIDVIDSVDAAFYNSDWNVDPYKGKINVGYIFTEEQYKAQENFIIVRSEQSDLFYGKPLPKGEMAISRLVKRPLYKKIGGKPQLVQRGEVEVLANTAETKSIEQSTTPDPAQERPTGTFSFKPSVKRRLPPTTRFKKADPRRKEVSTKVNEREARTWLAKRIPASIAVRIAELDPDTYGYTQDALIVLGKGAPSTTTYHEAFHTVFWNLATEEERKALMAAARKKYGIAPAGVNAQEWYEEQLAEDFERYVMERQESDTVIGRFFKTLWNWIQTAILHRTTIETFYGQIYRGAMASRPVVSKPFIRYSRVPGLTPKEERAAVDIIMQLIDGSIDEAMAAREQAIRDKKLGNKKDGEIALSDAYRDVLNLRNLFSTQGVMGELVGMAIEDVEGNPVDPETQAKILAIMKGLNAAILDINFETGDVTGVYKTDEEGNQSLDIIPGPLYFKILKELSNRGIRVKIRGSKVSFSEEAIGQSDEDQDLEFQEGEEDLREWWSIASHSISMKERLTPRLRRWMSRLPQMTIDGELVMDPIGMGMPLNYNPSEAYPLIQATLGNSTSVDDMLFRIAEEAKTDPLFASIYWQLASWQTDENQNALATQLFTHIAQKQDPDAYVTKQYSVRDEDGAIIGYRIVNFPSGGRRDAVISEAIMGRLFRLDKKEIAQLTSDMADLLSAQKPIDGKQFAAIMKAAGHSVPGATVRNMNAQQYRIVVQGLYNGIRAYAAGREQDAASTIGRTVRSHLAPFIKSRQQSVSLNVTGKKTYAWVNANFVGRQIMRIANNFEAMRSFYVSDTMYKDLPILRNIPAEPWRLVVTDGWKYDKERVGRDYTKFSSKEMLATMISLWRDNIYMLPVFNDSTVMAGVRIMRDKSFESSVEEILDVAYSEWKRTRNDLGAMSDVKSYNKNAAKAVLFEDLLTENGQVVEAFDRDAMREKLLNMIDDQSKEMVKTMRTTGMVAAAGPNTMIDMSVTNPEVLAKEFIASHMAVHGQLVLLTMGDPAFYKNPGDFFKRSKEIVSPGTFLNTKAVWTSKSGERVDLSQKPFFKLGIFSDITTDSELYEELKAMGLEEEYKKFSLTDGQTFIDIVSYRDREVGLNRWNDEKQDAMDILMRGELPSKYKRSVTFNPFKPFGFTLLKTSDGRIKPMQKKDSELVIYPFYGRKYVGGQRNKFYNPFHKAILEQMGYSFSVDEQGMETTVTYNPDKRRFDMVSSDECIKVGASGIATFPTKESPRGNTVVDASDPAGTLGQMQEHLFPTEDWRLQQETPPHHLGADAIYGIQTMKLIVADIDLDAEYTTRSGRKIKGRDLVREYKQSIARDIDTSMEKVEEMFSKADTEEGLKRFADMLRQEVLDRGMPDRFADALELVRDVQTGQLRTKLPLSHPLHVTRMESMLGSLIRKKVTKRKFEKGVSFVNASPAGFERMPRIVFNTDGSIKHYEVYAPIHDKRLLAFVNEEGYIDEQGMDRIHADKDMSQLLDMLVYRTPTEHKYSIFPIHVIGFLPTDDGVMFGPPELTRIAGLDFDIDKVRGFYFAVPKKGEKLTPKQISDNRKLDLMMAALRHPDVTRQMLTPGGFEQIEATNLEIRKRKAWNKVKDYKGAITHNTMDQIEGGIKLIDPMTQVRIARRFNAGQDLIGIAAVNNAVHAIWSQLQDAAFSYSRSVDYRDENGKSYTLSAMTSRYDASGQEIIRNIASTVAAFVDNGKNPQADYFNMNETTANVAYYLIHVGVPLEGVQMFLSQPAIVWWIEGLINNGGKPTQDMLERLKKGTNRFYSDYRKSDPTVYLDVRDMGNALSREYYKEHVGDDKFDKFQFAMLDNYLVFEKRATDVNALVQLTKAGDKGMGASQVDNYKVMRSYERMRDRKKPPFSESFEKIFDQQEEYMAKFLFKGIFRGNELVVKALKTPDLSSGMMTRMVDIFEQIKGTMLTDDEMNAIYRSLYDYLISSDPNFRMEDMIGERLWKQIEELGDTYIENNAFLSSLRMFGEDLQMPIGTMVDHSEEAMITADWKVLLEEHPQLAIDLARYSVMRNGFRYAPGGFSHLQPLELYTGAFSNLYSNYLSALAQMQHDMSLAGNYVKQFLQNNHTSMPMVQEVFAMEEGSDMPGPSIITLDGEALGFVIEVGEPDKMPYLYKYQGSLYELTARGTDRYYYERIPTYGAGDRNKIYQEYYFGNTGNEDQSGIFEKEITVKQKIYSRNKAATMVTNIDFKANKDPQSLIDNCT